MIGMVLWVFGCVAAMALAVTAAVPSEALFLGGLGWFVVCFCLMLADR